MNPYKATYAHFKRANPHVIAYRNRRWGTLIAKCLLLEGVIAAASILLLTRYHSALPFCILAAILLPACLFRPWRYFHKGWIGVVEANEYEECYENVDKSWFNPRYNGRHYVTYAHFKAIDDSGRRRTFKLERKYEAIYQNGDRVMSIPGIDYPIDLTVQDKKVCPRCGSIYPSINERCVTIGCGMPATLLDENN